MVDWLWASADEEALFLAVLFQAAGVALVLEEAVAAAAAAIVAGFGVEDSAGCSPMAEVTS
jgi:hypothetical protein